MHLLRTLILAKKLRTVRVKGKTEFQIKAYVDFSLF
jgi:hypothetical protein